MIASQSLIEQQVGSTRDHLLRVHLAHLLVIEFIPFIFMGCEGRVMPAVQSSVVVHDAVEPVLCLLGFVVAGPVFRLYEELLIVHEVVLWGAWADDVG